MNQGVYGTATLLNELDRRRNEAGLADEADVSAVHVAVWWWVDPDARCRVACPQSSVDLAGLTDKFHVFMKPPIELIAGFIE